MNKLKTSVGGITFETPLLLASGYITETPDFCLRSKRFGCAGMVTRSLKEHVPPERSRVPSPRYSIFGQTSMLNCEWGNEHPWTNWRDGWADKVRSSGNRLIISFSGRDIAGCANLIRAFAEQADAFEINVSCSHSGALHGNLNLDFDHLRELLRTIRPITKIPIWLKLSYSPIVVEMAKVGQEEGADAIVCTNTIGPGLLIDIETGLPKVGIRGGAGGVSGPAIFPIAMRCVYEISQAVSIPVVGVGGISSAEDVLQMMMAGASAVQLYTLPALKGPRSFKAIKEGLIGFLDTHAQYGSLRDIIGLSHNMAKSHRFIAPIPKVSIDKCTGCGICISSCAFGAIKLTNSGEGPKAEIKSNCTSCNACLGVCPPELGAISTIFNNHG